MAEKQLTEIEITKETLKTELITRWLGLRSRAKNILIKWWCARPDKRDPKTNAEYQACLFQARIASAQIRALDPAWNPGPSILTVPKGWPELRPDGWQRET